MHITSTLHNIINYRREYGEPEDGNDERSNGGNGWISDTTIYLYVQLVK